MRTSSIELRASRTASSTCRVTAASAAFSAASCSFPCNAAMSPSGVMSTRFGLGASAALGSCGFEAAGDGEGNVATSAILWSAFTASSSSCKVMGAGSSAGATAIANCATTACVPPSFIQSWGGLTIPQTFPGFSSSTPTCCNSRELGVVWTERTLARTTGGFGSSSNPTTCKATHDPMP